MPKRVYEVSCEQDMTSYTESQPEPGGNTKTPGSGPVKRAKPQGTQCFQWFFTLGQEHESQKIQESDVWGVLREHCKKFEFQLEQGEGGFLHYQGWFSLKNKERNMVLLKNMLGFNWIHLEPLKNMFAASKYCTKGKTFVKGPWSDTKRPLLPIITELRPWQEALVKEIDAYQMERRKIIWYTDLEGSSGKSTFAVHLSRERGDVVTFGGKFKRKSIYYAFAGAGNVKCVIFDIARKDFWDFDYGILEELKNGQVFVEKYESHVVNFDAPMVVVFANFEPEKTGLSNDRWDLRSLKKE